MTLPKTPAAYRLIDEDTGNFYVGSTSNLRSRLANHRSSIERGNHPNRQVRDGLRNWDRLRIEYTECNSATAAQRLEDSMLDFYHGSDEMLNVACTEKHTSKENGRICLTSEMKKLSDLAKSPESLHRRSEKLSGVAKSKDARQKMSNSAKQRGNNFSAEGIAKGRKIRSTPVTIDGVEYESARAAGRALGICSHTVKKRIISDSFSSWSFGHNEV